MLEHVTQDIVYALVASPEFTHDKRCFAARQSGLWISDNGGASWQQMDESNGYPAGSLASSVAVSPAFAADHTVFAGVHGTVLRSTDRGAHWLATALPVPPPFVSALALSPNYAADGIVLAATLEDGVFRSPDCGVTWHAWNFGLFDLTVLSIVISPAFITDRTVFVGTETGIFYSTNGGRAWRETGFPTACAPVLSLAVSPDFAQNGLLFAGTDTAGLFCTSDRGLSWTCVLGSPAINTILLAPAANTGMLAVSSERLWGSPDGGLSWEHWRPVDNVPCEFSAAVAPEGFVPSAILLLGLSDGQVIQVQLPDSHATFSSQ